MKQLFDFFMSPKQPLASLEWHKWLDNGWMHARTCTHENTISCSINNVCFTTYWWNCHFGFIGLDCYSCLCGWRMEAHTCFVDIGTNVV
jgi:hypothetical protein